MALLFIFCLVRCAALLFFVVVFLFLSAIFPFVIFFFSLFLGGSILA
jgi:hypothetical protein